MGSAFATSHGLRSDSPATTTPATARVSSRRQKQSRPHRLPSLRYLTDPSTIDTDEGPAEVGRLVMLGESERSVSDILRDPRRDGAGDREIDQWLIDYLADSSGEAPAADVIAASKRAGFSEDAIKNRSGTGQGEVSATRLQQSGSLHVDAHTCHRCHR
jgi:hypothetical protein